MEKTTRNSRTNLAKVIASRLVRPSCNIDKNAKIKMKITNNIKALEVPFELLRTFHLVNSHVKMIETAMRYPK